MLSPRDVHHILILDDDEILRDLLQALLTAEGFQITLVSSGIAAIRLLGGANFDLVLTDLRMPGLEGVELATQLRRAIPEESLLIGMSSTEPENDLLLLLDSFLLKPFDIQLLREAIAMAQQQNAVRNSIHTWGDPSQKETSPIATDPLDEETFSSLAKIIPSSQLRELFAMALKDIGKRQQRMTEAAAADDLAALQREAHAVKGSCGMIGALELQMLAATIEEAPGVHTSAVMEIPQACVRLQRMLETKFHTA